MLPIESRSERRVRRQAAQQGPFVRAVPAGDPLFVSWFPLIIGYRDEANLAIGVFWIFVGLRGSGLYRILG